MKDNSVSRSEETLIHEIRKAIGKIRYGSVEIVIHDSKVVQIECREKIRLDSKK